VKTFVLVVAGLAAGFVVAQWLAPAPPAGNLETASAAAAHPDDLPARIAELESALRAETEQRALLERRVAALGAEIKEARETSGAVASAGPVADAVTSANPPASDVSAGSPPFARGRRGPQTEEQRIEQLVAGGFAPDRAAWIERRTAELQMQAIQAQYARRRGETVDPALLAGGDQTLRKELGDEEYERYLAALGRPTKVGVFNVIASSPAERAGLRAGDAIVSYAGTRVFSMGELNNLTLEGTPGNSVIMEVERDGQRVQLSLPRGPLGIGGGPFGGPPGR
jgi:membrane-associated protease RseP (regulator of RpoE activity)